MVKQHINSINNMKLLSNSIVIFDRGYPSYDMFNFLEEKGVFFLMRVSSSSSSSLSHHHSSATTTSTNTDTNKSDDNNNSIKKIGWTEETNGTKYYVKEVGSDGALVE